jgi:hypothetical protein
VNARLYAEAHLDREDYLANYVKLIERITNQPLKPAKPLTSVKPAARGKRLLPQVTGL